MTGGFFEELRRRGVLHVAAAYVIAAWIIIQVADVFFPTWGIPGIALQYLLAAAILGFPIALVFGWKYDITSEGILKTPPADSTAQPAKLGRADYLTLGALAVAAVLIVYSISGNILDVAQDIEPQTASSEKRANSIAVLPFVNVSDDPSNEYFCDGVSEEILHRLAEYRDMHVIARTSSFAFKGSNLDAASLSAKLGVRYVLQGSVRKIGDELRISAELVDENNFQLWNQTFDRRLTAVFAIQSEIAAAVAESLASTVLASHVVVASYEPDIEAYQRYLLGREFLRTRPPGYQVNAIEQFDAAIEIDDRYAAPHAGRAIAMLLMYRDSTHYMDRQDFAEKAVATALDLDPDSAPALAAQGLLLSIKSDHAAAESSLRRALALDPNVVGARVWFVNALHEQDKFAENLREYETALALDPLDPRLAIGIAARYASSGEFEKAEQQYKRLLELPKPPETAYSGLFRLYDSYGKYVDLIAAGKQWILAHAIPASEPHYYYAYLAYAYARLGMNELAEYWQSRAEAVPPVDLGTSMRRAYIYRLQGRFDEMESVILDALAVEGIQLERASPFISRVVGAVQIGTGRYEQGIGLIEPTFVLDEEFDAGHLNIDFVHMLAYGYRRTGNNRRVNEILDIVENSIQRSFDRGYARDPQMLGIAAQNHVIAGRHDEALDALETAIGAGYLHYYLVLNDARWNGPHDNPRFQALLARMKANVDAQRAQVEAIDAETDFKATLARALESI